MQYPSYEDYMRKVLGYSCETPEMPNLSYGEGYTPYASTVNFEPSPVVSCNCVLEEQYPEIYYIIQPMVTKICRDNTKPITQELLEEMTQTIYALVEPEKHMENRGTEPELKNGDVRNPNIKKVEEKRENRSISNSNQFLKDLIKILILRELIGGKPPMSPPRPPFPGVPAPGRPPFPPPPRPPFPGGPGPVRPEPRDYQNMVMF